MAESEAIEAIQFDLKIGGEIHSQALRAAIDVAIQALEKYREIGSVEECRAAREKEIAKKPIDRCMYEECPTCGNVEIVFCQHCPDCGQKLDWGDEHEID